MAEIKDLLSEEIETEIEKLSSFADGSEEKNRAIKDLSVLHSLRINEIKVETERETEKNRYDLDLLSRADDTSNKEAQRKSDRVNLIVNIVVQVGLAIGGWIVYDIWNRRGLKFEETGTVTSPWTRNLMSKMTPKK